MTLGLPGQIKNVTVIFPLCDPLVFWDSMCFPDMDVVDEELVAEHLFRTCDELWEVRLWIRSDLLWKRTGMFCRALPRPNTYAMLRYQTFLGSTRRNNLVNRLMQLTYGN